MHHTCVPYIEKLPDLKLIFRRTGKESNLHFDSKGTGLSTEIKSYRNNDKVQLGKINYAVKKS
jgi:hypothetical protein